MAWVISAVASIGAAFTAGAAVAAGTAALTAATVGTIAIGVANAGVMLSVVGKVTKSKELMKIGSVMAIAGGVTALGAGLVSSAAAGSASASTAGSAGVTEGAAAGSAAGEAMANQAVDAAADGLAGNVSTFGIPDPSAGMSAIGDGAASAFAPAETALNTFGSKLQALPGVATEGAQVVQTAQAAAPATTSLDPSIGATGATGATAPKPGMLESAKDWYKNLSAAEKALVSTTVLQAGGSAIGGMFNGWSEEQKLQLQQEVNDENKRRYNTGVANANAVPVIAFKPMTSGLINSGRKG